MKFSEIALGRLPEITFEEYDSLSGADMFYLRKCINTCYFHQKR